MPLCFLSIKYIFTIYNAMSNLKFPLKVAVFLIFVLIENSHETNSLYRYKIRFKVIAENSSPHTVQNLNHTRI